MANDTDLHSFNLFLGKYGLNIFFVSGRIFDLKPDRWIELSCEWYARHGFREIPDDRYIGKLSDGRDVIRYKSVDAIVEQNPDMSDIARMLYTEWLAYKVRSDKLKEGQIKITPPPVNPPPSKPVPIDLPPKKEEPKTQRPPWAIKFSVWLTVATPIVFVVSYLLPPPWNVVSKAIFEALKVIFNFGG